VAIFNASGGDRKYFRAPFLTIPPSVYEQFWQTSTKGGFLFAQASLPLLLSTAKTSTKYPPTLLFTGATASIKASIGFSAFASAKFALRALSQSLAKEFGPQGVHVGHIVADGGFDTPIRKEMQPDGDEETWMSTEQMAESYWGLHIQGKRAWSWEVDLRPYLVLSLPFLTDGRKNGEPALEVGACNGTSSAWIEM
jgi:NAD(P)-dependent dehydrogenase (short-subunit alcohol dehydrogenase family)